ncbi:MAG: S41 family peptidase [Clostridia bacterium]|nr:S41 family peptidase [Clostridia bacterium]
MKKRILLTGSLMILLTLLCSCTFIPVSRLESVFRPAENSVITSGTPETTGISETGDTVTISREEYEKYRKFKDVYTLFDAANMSFYKETDQDKMIEYAARGVLAGLDDPYTYYYSPQEFEQMWKDDEGNYVGIGVLISANAKTKICTISRVFAGSPAEEAGVQRGDILYKVGDDLYVTATNLQEAVNIMRGEPGTDVDVTFVRNEEEITFTITRREININQIESKMLNKEIGYIAMYEFAGNCHLEFEQALNRLVSQGARGIILDLRDNPGGWVDRAQYIADLFMDEGELCYLVYRDGLEHHEDYPTKNGKVDVKLTVLINENSASSSEILTGALRDCADADVVGVKSFGKGVIQGVYPIGDEGAGYQMTIAQYFTPSGQAVHQQGITPDYIVELPEGDNGMYDFADTEKDVQLKKALEVTEEKLQEKTEKTDE